MQSTAFSSFSTDRAASTDGAASNQRVQPTGQLVDTLSAKDFMQEALKKMQMTQNQNLLFPSSEDASQEPPKSQPLVAEDKVGRNDLCPCGSGKKYKNCHGK